MQLDLPQTVRVAMIDDDLVFLDIDADAYFCLPLGPGLARLDPAGLDISDAALAEELIRAKLALGAGASGARQHYRPLTRPVRTARRLIEITPHLAPRLRAAHLLALCAAIQAALASRRKTFRQLLAPVTDPGPFEKSSLEGVLADVAIWRRLSPWLPLDGVCLFRSGMLLAFLRALGHRPIWMFGVRTWPFRAHCWLQVDDVALDDEAERLCAFTPILAS